ncbi:peptidogalycan biosysnthesis protein [Flavobacterium subsaxonicum]|uniref:8-amino-7-oxononanoate synthase n=1 Tax=Flavobacterium subsaxonicum WB 4.1-42 = DSM 21790 TaxID=1121898 RepID=A0A0A2N1C9_9FLAO|nr:peptidogalycan biosysnthesis protein [Flavobacterium subsaxonicum]KGO94255.1 8-amino-7-oxononanoate synthase [Flavobacterium subsaxonicum WB 4.1-42 = DSM 21790]
MAQQTSLSIYSNPADLPHSWDALAQSNIFLSRAYLAVLQNAAPPNMECHFIGLFKNNTLCGIALAQYIDLSRVNTFVEEKQSFCIKDYLFKRFTSHTLVIGNNTLTGQNAYLFNDSITETEGLQLLKRAISELKKQYKNKGIGINLLAIKDFNTAELPNFKAAGFKGYYTFCTQPNMIFTIRDNWVSIDDYVAALSTKYRTQYNRARKKADGIEKRKLSKTDIKQHEGRIHQLYLTVAGNASFNTFHLPENHFEVFKQQLGDNFLFYGYFLNDNLIGFNTLIKNGHDMDTYFLGYDASLQKEKMLYLNMLYDMVSYAIKKKFKHIIFARSAMEIKSSVGAVAEEVYGIIKHTNPLINLFTGRFFTYFDPVIAWKPRSPFK